MEDSFRRERSEPFCKTQVTLEEIEEILGEYDDGPFICGATPTAADVYWAVRPREPP